MKLFTEIDFNKDRNLETWIISDGRMLMDEYSGLLLDGYLAARDWLGRNVPMLVIPLEKPRIVGHIFKDVALISPHKFPSKSLSVFVVNGEFIELLNNEVYPLKRIPELVVLKNVDKLVHWHFLEELQIIGVVCDTVGVVMDVLNNPDEAI